MSFIPSVIDAEYHKNPIMLTVIVLNVVAPMQLCVLTLEMTSFLSSALRSSGQAGFLSQA
jgi:hypothetical protein